MIFILASYTVFLAYLFLAYNVYKINPKGIFNKLFVIVCILFAFCSMLEIIKYISYDDKTVFLGDWLSKIIWRNYPALMLEISLYLAQKDWYMKIRRKKYNLYFYIPGILLTILELFINISIRESIISKALWIIGWIDLYLYILACLYFLWQWYRRTELPAEKKHIRTILILGIITVVLAAFNDFVLAPINEFYLSMDQFIIFFFFVGAIYLNYKYKFFTLSSLVTAEDIVDKIMEMVLIVDMEGNITDVNRRVEKMLEYKKDNLVNSRLEKVTNLKFSTILQKLNTFNRYIDNRELYCMTSKGEKISISAKISAVKGKNGGIAGIIVILNDQTLIRKLQVEITERKAKESQLSYMSMHDSLTGVYNRTYFSLTVQWLQTEYSTSMGIIVCDLDGLKFINDTLGHDKGDTYLIDAAQIIETSLDDNAVLCRIGGDEFAILMPHCTEKRISTICKRIRNAVSKYNLENNSILLSISLGSALCNGSCKSIEELIKEADNNMYREKLYNTHSIRNTMIQVLMRTLEARDFITEGHADRLKEMAIRLGEFMDLSEQRLLDLQLLAQFHDIGKVGIPDSILFKPSSLTDSEKAQMQRHCEIGFRIAQGYPDLNNISDLILKHHERWDGKGYPLGIREEDIPLECRILAIIDAYDAMTNDRPYRKAMYIGDALSELKRNAGTQFDPTLVNKFLEMIDECVSDKEVV
ncbi:MAG TPA: HD domain-containing phosphohydrolase [Patescibacteria group bacterium]|nr:HD domain-containing phosphohydrolase [Patescibacteria group bacterium]